MVGRVLTAAVVLLLGVACSDDNPTEPGAVPDAAPEATPDAPAGTPAPSGGQTPTAGPRPTGTSTPPNGLGQCLEADAIDAGFIQNLGPGDLNCTSKDVDTSFAEITQYSINGGPTQTLPAGGVIKCAVGDVVTANVFAKVRNNAQERYDFGFWVSEQGESALTGDQCMHFNLVPGQGGSTTEEELPNAGTPDQCGDMAAGITATIPLGQMTFQCEAGTTQVALEGCSAWSNSTTGSADRICPVNPPGGATGFRTGTTPETSAKCRCEDLDVPILVAGVIRVDKVTVPSGDPQSFAFAATGSGFATPFSLTDASTPHSSGPLDPGTYTVTETVPTGWTLTARACVLTGTTTAVPFDPISNGVSVELGPGQDITCTFTNTKQASVTIRKVTVPAESPPVGSFSFTQSFDGSGGFSLGHNGTKAFTNVTPGTAYSVVEADPAPAYGLTAISCTGAATWTGTVSTRTLSVTPAPGETIVCTFTNTRAAVSVTKTATETFTRRYLWAIDKVADPTSVTLDPGQVYNHPYSVAVSVTGQNDHTFAVNGTITIANPTAIPVSITAVADNIDGVGAATVQCPVTFPHSLAAGGQIQCTYSSSLPNGTTRTNTASVTLGGITAPFTGTASVDFTGVQPTAVEDDCIDVKDEGDLGNSNLGKVCVPPAPTGAFAAPKTFSYTRLVPTGEAQCGVVTYDNTATGTTSTTLTKITDNASVIVTIECPEGCTLTQGYWKTHNPAFAQARNGNGPPPDATWDLLPAGALSGFFTVGMNSYPKAGPNPASASFTWFAVFWTAPKGNVYYNLAHQYMAAKLNVLDLVVPSTQVANAILAAEDIFDSYTPAQIGALKANNSLRQQIITLAGILGAFNEGQAGTEHCNEDPSSSIATLR